MIPFENTWPYEQFGRDIYFSSCPVCSAVNVLLPLKPQDLQSLREGVKKLLVLPCCRNKLTLVEADGDYVRANRPLRRYGNA
ncbi:hypothetical protein O9H85_15375 [Paenibacillus filicis]|uniref:Uncharacterized protein n=1 Tax=Paenibacillus gyeongsangnamensis TaxID=3388067 RepID=A0ABT4QA83_9BACL|nr:hypothetical protein [Paenibacillus filicis]MCZ8513789.1 hypothetical protein [Paenibacillus filicis]